MLMTGVDWFQTFANSIYLPVIMIAFGMLMVVQAPRQKELTVEEIEAAPTWMHWLIRGDRAKFQRRAGWIVIGGNVLLVLLRAMHGN